MKYLHLFENNDEFEPVYEGTGYTEPWTSVTKKIKTLTLEGGHIFQYIGVKEMDSGEISSFHVWECDFGDGYIVHVGTTTDNPTIGTLPADIYYSFDTSTRSSSWNYYQGEEGPTVIAVGTSDLNRVDYNKKGIDDFDGMFVVDYSVLPTGQTTREVSSTCKMVYSDPSAGVYGGEPGDSYYYQYFVSGSTFTDPNNPPRSIKVRFLNIGETKVFDTVLPLESTSEWQTFWGYNVVPGMGLSGLKCYACMDYPGGEEDPRTNFYIAVYAEG